MILQKEVLSLLLFLTTISSALSSTTPIVRNDNLIDQCVRAVKDYDFDIAEGYLEILDDTKIDLMVQNVYDSKTDSFNRIICFADYARNASKSFKIFNALNAQVKPGHKYGYKLRRLIRSLSKIMYQPNILYNTKQDAEMLAHSCTQSMIEETKKIMETFLLSSRCCIDSKVTDLVDRVFIFDRDIFKDILDQVITKVYGKIPTTKLFMYTGNFTYLEQTILWSILLFNNMPLVDKLSPAITDFIILIRELMAQPEYLKVDKKVRSEMEKIWVQLPKGLKTALTQSSVCLRNVMFDEPLYPFIEADVPDYKNISKFRKVFTWRPWRNENKAHSPVYSWKISRTPSENPSVFIKNIEFNEFLFSADGKYNYDRERGSIFTGPLTDEKSEWFLEPTTDENHVYIKNHKHRYLYPAVDDFAADGDRRRVFIWIEGESSFREGIWEVFSCSQ